MSELRQPTPFELAVYEVVRAVPRGKVTTYGRVHARLGRGSARAVGSALARNPFAPQVPCHRVVCADGRPGGFNGETGGAEPARKLKLLRAEGVPFTAAGRVEPRAFEG
jgi:methylated-DNA-[protein]-cysteine S-methyltransferase